ncbi:hypothetical protein EYF80_043086 [Liparis tanakae]|uniref:Uncharacterized protein n=1 Tax=Liparis tanakae TaxID=230148 RepID=A0A4Z2FZQ8_9TELE|nr:hypothetical protein EYF80_043086 [Liparis tanakae]
MAASQRHHHRSSRAHPDGGGCGRGGGAGYLQVPGRPGEAGHRRQAHVLLTVGGEGGGAAARSPTGSPLTAYVIVKHLVGYTSDKPPGTPTGRRGFLKGHGPRRTSDLNTVILRSDDAPSAAEGGLEVTDQTSLSLALASFKQKSFPRHEAPPPRRAATRRCFFGERAVRGGAAELRAERRQHYEVVRGLTGVWESKGEGPCWNGLGLWPSGVAGEGLCRTRPAGWMAPGRVWRENKRSVMTPGSNKDTRGIQTHSREDGGQLKGNEVEEGYVKSVLPVGVEV